MNAFKIIFLLWIALSFCFCGNEDAEVKIELGKKAPAFELELLDGSKLSSSELAEEYVLIDFWASWCGPCIRELPELMQLSKSYKDKLLNNGKTLKILTIAIEKKEGSSARVSERYGFDWAWQAEEASRFVRFSEIASSFEVTEIPSKFLLSPKGTFLSINRPYHEIEKILSNRLQ